MTPLDSVPELTADDVKAALKQRHGADTGSGMWVCIEEAFCGFASGGSGGIDLLALGAWATAKAPGLPGAGKLHKSFSGSPADWTELDARHPVVAYEVKVSRADFRRELYGYEPGPGVRRWRSRPVPAWPGKAWDALGRSHFFMFAVPKGLLKDEEVEQREQPDEGKSLWLPSEAGLIEVDGAGCHVRVAAPRRQARALTVPETAELIRHAVNPNKQRQLATECALLRRDNERLQKALYEREAA